MHFSDSKGLLESDFKNKCNPNITLKFKGLSFFTNPLKHFASHNLCSENETFSVWELKPF